MLFSFFSSPLYGQSIRHRPHDGVSTPHNTPPFSSHTHDGTFHEVDSGASHYDDHSRHATLLLFLLILRRLVFPLTPNSVFVFLVFFLLFPELSKFSYYTCFLHIVYICANVYVIFEGKTFNLLRLFGRLSCSCLSLRS
ncbi:hypothetical protein M408DRAFT_172093 [Serendipita vermifera MAFF 305830]|uniref:Uncharacterized protein n=1 Tax=Serendipita vermifera MAFF 305830 TaxID=933852 RepID=A0A0C3B757_SERVB|nr:hypothetical protein M408DRAFT_172093 [Serendipita vermifera MAFF 305830]